MKYRFFKLIIFLIVSTVFLSSCKKDKKVDKKPWTHTKKRLNFVEPIPYCLEKKIRFMMKYNDELDRTGVWRWTMANGSIYYIIFNEYHGCPSCGYSVYNSDCENICSLESGASGLGTGTCPENVKKAEYEEEVLIWKSFDF